MKYRYILLVWMGCMHIGCATSHSQKDPTPKAPDKKPVPADDKKPVPADDKKPVPADDKKPVPPVPPVTSVIDAQGFDTVTGIHQHLGVDRNLALPPAEAARQLREFQARTFVNTYGVVDAGYLPPYDQRELYPQGYEVVKRLRSPYQQRPTAPFFHMYNMQWGRAGGEVVLVDQPRFIVFLPPASLGYVSSEVKVALQPYLQDLQTVEIAFVPQRRFDYCTDLLNPFLIAGGTPADTSIQLKAHTWVRPDTPVAFLGGYFNGDLSMGLFSPSIPGTSLSGAGGQDPQVGTMSLINVNTHDNTLSGNVGNLFTPTPLAENGAHCFFSTYSLVVYPPEHRAIVTLHWVLDKDFYEQVLLDFAAIPEADKTIGRFITYAKAHMANNALGAPLMQFPRKGVEQLEQLSGLATAAP